MKLCCRCTTVRYGTILYCLYDVMSTLVHKFYTLFLAKLTTISLLAQLVERETVNLEVNGSIPLQRALFCSPTTFLLIEPV